MQTRLEKSFPAWALEPSSDYTAVEAEMDRFVKADKGGCVVWGDDTIFLENPSVTSLRVASGQSASNILHLAT
jgi:hypothetical protein